jgi:hypothetical protein
MRSGSSRLLDCNIRQGCGKTALSLPYEKTGEGNAGKQFGPKSSFAGSAQDDKRILDCRASLVMTKEDSITSKGPVKQDLYCSLMKVIFTTY